MKEEQISIDKSTIVGHFWKIMAMLPVRQHRFFWWLLAGMILLAGLETIAVGIIALFASAISDPEAVLTSRYVLAIKAVFGERIVVNPKELILGISLLVVLLILAKNCVRGITAYASTRYAVIVEIVLGDAMLGGFMCMPHEWHMRQNPADLVLAMQWRAYFGRGFILSVLNALSDIILVGLMMSVLMVVQPLVLFGVLGVVGGVAWLIFWQTRRVLDSNAIKARELNERVNRGVAILLYGIKDVVIFGRARQGMDEFTKELQVLGRITAVQTVLISTPAWVLETIGFAMISAIVWSSLVVMEISPARLTGSVALLAVTAWRVLPAVSRILGSLTKFRNVLPFLDKSLKYIQQAELEGLPKSCIAASEAIGFHRDIQFSNVTFQYQARETASLKNISLIIPKGSAIGIIGHSGGGKSTFVDILIGLLSPSAGCVLIDGVSLENTERFSWMRSVGYVPQTPYIFDGTLAENIAFSIREDELDRDRVLACCEMAFMDYLKTLPKGIDTRLGERGVRLSGGQVQRVAIARALYNDPAVLIFDEATSALDARSERAIQKTIYDVRGGRTLVVVAHRLNTVEQCDMIIWLDNGQVRMTGSPAEVLPIYAETTDVDTLVEDGT